MQPRPVQNYDEPAYPTRRDFLAAGTAALAAAGISGCNSRASAAVAPIFAHGEGRGATGCVVMSPPEFLSEEEALQVIREELAKAGIKLGEGMPLPDVTVDYEDPDSKMWQGDHWLGDPKSTVSKPADLAAVDRRQRVGVTIVTSEDCDRFRSYYGSSVSMYDTKGLAQNYADALRSQAKHDLCVGVFYDPIEKWEWGNRAVNTPEDWDAEMKRVSREAEERARSNLRRQVHDFVAWLEKRR